MTQGPRPWVVGSASADWTVRFFTSSVIYTSVQRGIGIDFQHRLSHPDGADFDSRTDVVLLLSGVKRAKHSNCFTTFRVRCSILDLMLAGSVLGARVAPAI